MKKLWTVLYLILTISACALPFAGKLWYREAESSENRVLAEAPKLRTEEGLNINYLADAGTYFEDHFAYRQEMVTADALLRGKLLGVSTAEGVIKGTGGWLYYKDSLEDYLGGNVLSDRAAYNIAHTLKMMQTYVEEQGGQFLFTIAPNKNTLYGENMPYYYKIKIADEHNREKIAEMLLKQGVNYADLFAFFAQRDETLYHLRDSHWNNKGAALVSDLLLDMLGKAHTSHEGASYTVQEDFEGDLDKMLYPLAVTPEEEIYYDTEFTYEYTQEIESTFDPLIQTVNDAKQGSLLMYRDSFGNALLPFVAEEFGSARFSRGVPYYLGDMQACQADTVIVERAERFVPDMRKNPPVVQTGEAHLAPLRAEILPRDSANLTNCQITAEGAFTKISGTVDEAYMSVETEIYVRVDGAALYEAFPVTLEQEGQETDFGYVLYLEEGQMQSGEHLIELFTVTEGVMQQVYQGYVES
ncbi:MAG: hypothetical protein Q4C50_05225 [Eubacteriales bacterium]|nr:hypothetical protein [Eubacteriales bacterium]